MNSCPAGFRRRDLRNLGTFLSLDPVHTQFGITQNDAAKNWKKVEKHLWGKLREGRLRVTFNLRANDFVPVATSLLISAISRDETPPKDVTMTRSNGLTLV